MKYVHLALPFGDHISVPTLNARDYAVDYGRKRFGVVSDPLSFSVPVHCFNMLFSRFLNDEGPLPEGASYDYFCMLHSDVVPLTPHWLDVLIDELEESGAAAIHAPVAIKDLRGVTSTAVGGFDDWAPRRKLTVRELQELPSPFGLADVLKLWQINGPPVGALNWGLIPTICLLPNTGCLVIKKADWCWDFPGFEIHSRLDAGNLPNGRKRRVAEFAPEDWRFGAWMAQRDLKVLGSTKVRTTHLGGMPFTTDCPWGQEKDDEFLKGGADAPAVV